MGTVKEARVVKRAKRGGQRDESGYKNQVGTVKEAKVFKRAKKVRSERREWVQEPSGGNQREEWSK